MLDDPLEITVRVEIECPEVYVFDSSKVSDDFIQYLAGSIKEIYPIESSDDESSELGLLKAIKEKVEAYLENASIYDDQVRLTLENTGNPARNYPYKAILPSGKTIYGKTDSKGITQRLRDENPRHVIIEWGVEEANIKEN